jgi:hypothetical protein
VSWEVSFPLPMALLDVVDATLLRGRSPSPPFGRAGLTCSRGRGGLAAVGVAAAGRADMRAVAAAGGGSGGQRQLLAGVPAVRVACEMGHL